MHGQYPERVSKTDVDKEGTHKWLSSASLKGGTVVFIIPTHDQSLATAIRISSKTKQTQNADYVTNMMRQNYLIRTSTSDEKGMPWKTRQNTDLHALENMETT